jgi:hypothetical protein
MAQIVKNDFFRIMNGAGRFSTGGKNPRWTKQGKIWTSESALVRHLKLAYYDEYDVLVVQYGLISSGARSTGFYLNSQNGKMKEGENGKIL